MSEHRVRRLPVVPLAGDGVPKGILSNKDALGHVSRFAPEGLRARAAAPPGASRPFDVPISEFMTRDVITVSQDDDIRVAASKMMIFGVGGLVVDDAPGGRVALVTERDIVRTLSQEEGDGRPDDRAPVRARGREGQDTLGGRLGSPPVALPIHMHLQALSIGLPPSRPRSMESLKTKGKSR